MKSTISSGIGWRHSNTLTTTKEVHYPTKSEVVVSRGVVPKKTNEYSNGPLNHVSAINRDAVTHEFSGPAFKARPMKHWRLRLQPNNKTSNTNPVSLMDVPGGYVKTNSCACTNHLNSSTIVIDDKLIKSNPVCNNPCVKIMNNGYIQVGVPENPKSYQIQTGIYNVNNLNSNKIKSGVTLLSKAYYGDTKAYLRSRCKSYDQMLSINPMPGVEYVDKNGHPKFPSDNCNGAQIRKNANCTYPKCSNKNLNCPNNVIYKPNNVGFSKQGGVSSGTRTLNLRVNTVNMNGNSFYTAYGSQGANAGKYRSEYNPGYFVKNVYQPLNCCK